MHSGPLLVLLVWCDDDVVDADDDDTGTDISTVSSTLHDRLSSATVMDFQPRTEQEPVIYVHMPTLCRLPSRTAMISAVRPSMAAPTASARARAYSLRL